MKNAINHPRYFIAAIIEKCSSFSYRLILSQPYSRSHRQALAKLLTGELMVGRVTKHFYCKKQRVPGAPEACIDCYRAHNIIVEDSEEHLVFDCITTRHIRRWFWRAIPPDDACRLFNRTLSTCLEALFATEHGESWAIIGEPAHKVWCRPIQAWRRHQKR